MKTTSALIAVSLVVQQAHGRGWIGADSFSSPSNTDNHCNTEEESGFAWKDLTPGSSVDAYSGFNFKGYTCQDNFALGKRDVLLSRGIQSKCIAGTASKDYQSNPSFSCSDKSFSIDHVQVSTEEDQDLEFIYGYSSGATCKHIAPCSKSGSTIKNSQCGGADSVTVGIPKDAPKEICSFGIHSVGFNCASASIPVPSSTAAPLVSSYVVPSIYTIPGNSSAPATPTGSYHPPGTAPIATPKCTAECSTIPIHSYSSPIFSYSTPVGTAPIGTAPGSSYVPVTSQSTPAPYPTSSATHYIPTAPESTDSAPATHPADTQPVETPPVQTRPVKPSFESTPTVPATHPAESSFESTPSTPLSSSLGNSPTEATSSHASVVTAPVYTTEIIHTTLTTCPVTNTITTSGVVSLETITTVSTILSTQTSTVSLASYTSEPSAPETSVLASTSGKSPVPASSSSPAPSVAYPSVLPKCLNTWIKLTTCENNAASDCYCTNSEFTKSVQDCVTSWSYDDNEIQSALSYLAGICAPHASENPGIVTHVPKTITLVPTPSTASPIPSGTSGVTVAPVVPGPSENQPETTISISTSTIVPVLYSEGPSSGSPIPSSSTTSIINTAVTVPQVQFTTANSPVGASGAPDVGLAAGSPSPVAASATAALYGGATPSGYGPTGVSTFASSKPVPFQPSSSLTPFTGAARKITGGFVGIVVAGLVSFIVLA